MNDISCYDSSGELLKLLYQWDYNQTITIRGLDTSNISSVHFCNRSSDKALVVSPKEKLDQEITVDIPNILLRQAQHITLYLYQNTENDGLKTTHTIHIPVTPRIKPDSYEFKDNVEYVNLVAISEDMKEAINKANNTIDDIEAKLANGEFNGENYVLTDADKTEIARIVLAEFIDVSEVGQ